MAEAMRNTIWHSLILVGYGLQTPTSLFPHHHKPWLPVCLSHSLTLLHSPFNHKRTLT
jgi:hypothetical protein